MIAPQETQNDIKILHDTFGEICNLEVNAGNRFSKAETCSSMSKKEIKKRSNMYIKVTMQISRTRAIK